MASAAPGSKAYSQSEWEDEIWAVVFAVVNAASGPPPEGKLKGLIAKAKTAAKNKAGFALVPNPFFVLNEICAADDESSSKTVSYLRARLAKTVASFGQGAVTGHFLKPVTGVDPVSIAKTGVSIGATIAHVEALKAIAKRWRNSRTVSGWIDFLGYLKMAKGFNKNIALISSSIPYLPSSVGLALGGTMFLGGMAFQQGNDAVLTRIAIELHWRAYREQVLARSGGAVGPASAILIELFTKRTESRILGKYDTDAIIREPAGWMAIKDKIGLL